MTRELMAWCVILFEAEDVAHSDHGHDQQQYSGKLWCLNYARLVLKECYSSSLKLIKGMVDSYLHAECILPSSQCYSKF